MKYLPHAIFLVAGLLLVITPLLLFGLIQSNHTPRLVGDCPSGVLYADEEDDFPLCNSITPNTM